MIYQNLHIITGNLGADANLDVTSNGRRVLHLRVVTEFRTAHNGSTNVTTTWHSVTAWGTLAEKIAHWRKGDLVHIEGPVFEREMKGFLSWVTDSPRQHGHDRVRVAGEPERVGRIYDEGHAIGNPSYDHRYEKLYPSVDGFFREMAQTDEIIYEILGVRPLILRAPGGRIGHFTAAYAPALKAHGYVEHDWNVSSADAAPGHPVAQDFIDNIAGEAEGEATAHTAIILMHSSEGHEETVKALPEIIRVLREKGYAFGVVTPMTPQPW